MLAEGAPPGREAVVAAYDAAALAYAERFGDELIEKPFDIWLLERIAELAEGPIMDLGCGPGQIAAFLADTGAEVHGLDASAAMIALAQAAYPDLDFQVGRFHQLLRPRTASAWGAIVAWYAFVHLAPSELPQVLRTAANTLAADGLLALAVHLGDDVVHVDELCGWQWISTCAPRPRSGAGRGVSVRTGGAGVVRPLAGTLSRRPSGSTFWRGGSSARQRPARANACRRRTSS